MLKLIFAFAFLIAFHFAQPAPANESQSLLDDLSSAQTLGEAQPIIAALWDTWINAHQSDEEKALMFRGMSAMNAGRLDAAEKIFGDLIAVNTEFTEAWNKRATVRFMLWKFEESRADVYEVLKREPRHFGAISGLGMINLRLGELDKAMQSYEYLRRVFPASPEAERYIPIIRKELGRTDL